MGDAATVNRRMRPGCPVVLVEIAAIARGVVQKVILRKSAGGGQIGAPVDGLM